MRTPFWKEERIMTPQELDKLTEEQKSDTSTSDIEKCKQLKTKIENDGARFVVKKQVVPFTRWYLENLKDSSEIIIDIGDQIELIDLEQSFSRDNVYRGTTRNVVLELGANFIKLKTPDPHALLITEGVKVFTLNKPLYKNEFNPTEALMNLIREETKMKNENIKKLTSAAIVTTLIALIVIVIIVLV